MVVFPPYDLIANEGISPDVQKYLETELSKDTRVSLIKFPYMLLKNIPYQNVFDKKYCKPILDRLKADVAVMTKLELVSKAGSMSSDKWGIKIKIYRKLKQVTLKSDIHADSLTGSEMKLFIEHNCSALVSEIIEDR